jgi:hypothetical protein
VRETKAEGLSECAMRAMARVFDSRRTYRVLLARRLADVGIGILPVPVPVQEGVEPARRWTAPNCPGPAKLGLELWCIVRSAACRRPRDVRTTAACVKRTMRVSTVRAIFQATGSPPTDATESRRARLGPAPGSAPPPQAPSRRRCARGVSRREGHNSVDGGGRMRSRRSRWVIAKSHVAIAIATGSSPVRRVPPRRRNGSHCGRGNWIAALDPT